MQQTFSLWNHAPEPCGETPTITAYIPETRTTDAAVVIFPGGGYTHRAKHEGEGYAEFLTEHGVTAFVVEYRVHPHVFPIPLLDARRAVRFVRYYADRYGISKDKIAVMGSSAGGHLAALVSTYRDLIDGERTDEIDKEDYLPNRQILCYPVINLYDERIAHVGSGKALLSDAYSVDRAKQLTPCLLVKEDTPAAFVWHTAEDAGVNVENSLEYITALRRAGVDTELHIFPHGRHGLGLTERNTPLECHVAQWSDLLIRWLKYTW